jgi:hypothetical protein
VVTEPQRSPRIINGLSFIRGESEFRCLIITKDLGTGGKALVNRLNGQPVHQRTCVEGLVNLGVGGTRFQCKVPPHFYSCNKRERMTFL